MQSPLLFLVFNRPEVTQQVFDSIRQAKPKKLYIASDGPRLNQLGEVERCQAVQKIVSEVDWPCEVIRLTREKNLGCKVAVSSAIDWFFSHEPEGIILEDDCLPHPDFFSYCDELLEKYRHDDRIGIISGTALVDMESEKILWGKEDFVFCKYFSIWGWASWRRVWKDYDVNLSAWKDRKNDISAVIHNKKLQAIHKKNFEAIFTGTLNTWDYQLGFAMWASNRLAVTPKFNLIENIGFGQDATHTVRRGTLTELRAKKSLKRLNYPLVAPNLLCENNSYATYLEKISTTPIVFKILSHIYNELKKFLKI